MINNAPEENNEQSNSDQMVEVRSVLKMKEEETKDNDGCGEERKLKQQLVERALYEDI